MTAISSVTHLLGRQLIEWLTDAGFRFNPFVHLDASADPRLGDYLIMHQAFATAWGEWPSLAFAPAGGGKTALRLQVMRACWSGPDTGHPFPVPYLPSMDSRGGLPVGLEAHSRSILQSGALQLLLALLLRPHWWQALDASTQRLVRGLLDHDLPTPLGHYLSQLTETNDLMTFITDYGLPMLGGEPPPEDRWRSLCSALATTPPAAVPDETMERLDAFVDMLVGTLGLSSVYLLVDGVDGFMETALDPGATIALIAPLLRQIEGWSQRRIFFKAFLPIDVAAKLEMEHAALWRSCRRTDLHWSAPSLAEVIRQRVFVATQGAYGSLDAVGAPDLTDVETQLVRAATPLPREVLLLTQRLLWEHVRRGHSAGKLDVADLEAALAWYRDQRALNGGLEATEHSPSSLRKGENER